MTCGMCPSCPTCPKSVACCLIRVSFGLAVALVGLTHYMDIQGFTGMVSMGLGPLSGLGTLWAYILPGLMVVGGVLLAAGAYHHVASWCVGLALGSIIVGMPLKSVIGGVPLGDVIPAVNNTLIWLLVYGLTIKMACCEMEKKH